MVETFVSHKGDTTSSSGNKEATLKSKSGATLKSVPAVDSSIEKTIVSHNIETSFT